jgi:hypothetical protein
MRACLFVCVCVVAGVGADALLECDIMPLLQYCAELSDATTAQAANQAVVNVGSHKMKA